MTIVLDSLTLGDVKQLSKFFNGSHSADKLINPFIGIRVIVRTYSAGVHIGTLVGAENMECHLTNALRLWKWEGGGLSLSAIATNGVQNGRLNKTPEIFLTDCIEFIPISESAEKTFEKFIED
jgi:hypothetical protein